MVLRNVTLPGIHHASVGKTCTYMYCYEDRLELLMIQQGLHHMMAATTHRQSIHMYLLKLKVDTEIVQEINTFEGLMSKLALN